MDKKKKVGLTVTGEVFYPCRLFYKIENRKKVNEVFDRLKCIEEDPEGSRWVWFLKKEAKSINLNKKYSDVPVEVRPLVIGSFVWKDDNNLILDLRSYQRAIEAIKFFDKFIPRSAALVTHCASVNRIFSPEESTLSNFDCFFENNPNLIEIDPEKIEENIRKDLSVFKEQGSAEDVIDFFETKENKLKEFEKFPLYFYEDGIKPLDTVFTLRQYTAFEHWKGNTDYTPYDFCKMLATNTGKL